MKLHTFLLAFPLLCLTSCFSGDNATDNDDANDAAGTADPYLAREVVGVWQLSTDQRFGYDEPCNILNEGIIENTFNIGATEKLETLDYQNGCKFKWKGGETTIAFGGAKPYPSIYHAEYIFDKMYQGGKGQVSGQMGYPGEKPALSGPDPEGTGANGPADGMLEGNTKTKAGADIDADKSPNNDSSAHVTGITSAAEQFAKPVKSAGKFQAVSGVGDKAVWDPSTSTIHVLYNNHIVSVGVQTKDKPTVRQQKAQALALLVLNYFTEKSSS